MALDTAVEAVARLRSFLHRLAPVILGGDDDEALGDCLGHSDSLALLSEFCQAEGPSTLYVELETVAGGSGGGGVGVGGGNEGGGGGGRSSDASAAGATGRAADVDGAGDSNVSASAGSHSEIYRLRRDLLGAGGVPLLTNPSSAVLAVMKRKGVGRVDGTRKAATQFQVVELAVKDAGGGDDGGDAESGASSSSSSSSSSGAGAGAASASGGAGGSSGSGSSKRQRRGGMSRVLESLNGLVENAFTPAIKSYIERGTTKGAASAEAVAGDDPATGSGAKGSSSSSLSSSAAASGVDSSDKANAPSSSSSSSSSDSSDLRRALPSVVKRMRELQVSLRACLAHTEVPEINLMALADPRVQVREKRERREIDEWIDREGDRRTEQTDR